LSKSKNIKHGFFKKLSKNSNGIYKNLNYDLNSFVKKKNIATSLKIVAKKIKTNSKKIVLLSQIHSNKFYYIGKKLKIKKTRFRGDAIITNQKKTPIGILTADCAPILIHDKKGNMISAIHAGWKGAFKGIIQNVIKFMLKNGCTPETMTAVIGPCISIKNYEVKKDFKDKFIKKDKKNKFFFKKIKNKTYFSLNKYIYLQLKNLNIKNIEIINKDTFDVKNNFFSARRSLIQNDNDYGRNISVIMIN
tara:strand:+ start:142 stop:885 length:744 start_codon:yes stop_codon:yes gene_type:complete